MNLDTHTDKTIRVSLSRRNLEELLRMLDLKVGSPILHRSLGDGLTLHVKAEENAEHYHSESREASVRGIAGPGLSGHTESIKP